ncbi:hypothetical protein MGN70_004006 [Eutypa lata]|nr:hypothetical protein MGN70_004006 [Eutypa lata]
MTQVPVKELTEVYEKKAAKLLIIVEKLNIIDAYADEKREGFCKSYESYEIYEA